MKRSHIITIIIIIILAFAGYKVLASTTKQDERLTNWNKAWILKFEEMDKKEQAQKLLDEAEKARIEKEKLLFWTGSESWKLSQ